MTNLTLSILDYIFKFQIRNFLNFALNFMSKICTYPKIECVNFTNYMSKIWTYICTNFGHNKNIKEKENTFLKNSFLERKNKSSFLILKKDKLCFLKNKIFLKRFNHSICIFEFLKE